MRRERAAVRKGASNCDDDDDDDSGAGDTWAIATKINYKFFTAEAS